MAVLAIAAVGAGVGALAAPAGFAAFGASVGWAIDAVLPGVLFVGVPADVDFERDDRSRDSARRD